MGVKLLIRIDKGCMSEIEEYPIDYTNPQDITQYCEIVRNYSNKSPVLRFNEETLSSLMIGEFIKTGNRINQWRGYDVIQDELLPNYYIGIEPVDENYKSKKPPLGLKPKWLHEEQRIREICEAMARYNVAGKQHLKEWLEELLPLLESQYRRNYNI